MSNPAGADIDGGEFVELYNAGDDEASLAGCLLTTDKLDELELPDEVIAADDYYVVELYSDLLNDGGSVELIKDMVEEVVEYPALDDDEAWALVDEEWEVTELNTPGDENQSTPEEPEAEAKDDSELEPCGDGKFRNPETNRCKLITGSDDSSSLKPCRADQYRNPETNRCKLIKSSSRSLKPCDADQERNPETNRCRKVASTSTSLKPCKDGYERNPDTNRCRKVSGTNAVNQTANLPVSGPAPLHPGILISTTALALGYGAYEYRMDFANWGRKFKNFFQK